MSTLLPCPFCGSEAELGTVRYSHEVMAAQQWTQDTFHFVNCVTCGVSNVGIIGHDTPADAAAAWNSRHSSGRGTS